MAQIAHYDVGDRWTPQATFTVGGVATDPANLIVRQQDAVGVESVILNSSSPGSLTPSSTPVARVSAGVYKVNPGISLTASGYWFVRFEGTGTAEASEEHQAIVDPTEFTADAGISTRALVGLAETKDWLERQQVSATASDLKIVRMINAASEAIHNVSGREFKPHGTNPAARAFDVSEWTCNPSWRTLAVGDLAGAPSSVSVADELGTVVGTLSGSDYDLLPRVREPWRPYDRLRLKTTKASAYLVYGHVFTVTASWGFPVVPEDIRQAAMDAVAYWLDRDVEHYRQDFSPVPGAAEGSTLVIASNARPMILSLPPEPFAIANAYREVHLF